MFKIDISNSAGQSITVFISKKETMNKIIEVLYPTEKFYDEFKGKIALKQFIEEE